MEDTIPTDDDIDSLADIEVNPFSILPYPGPHDFDNWCESQFSGYITPGSSEFLHHLGIEEDNDTYYWTNINPREYINLLGANQYDKVRNILIELQVIRRFIDYQHDIKPNATKGSYVDYFVFREQHLAMNQRHYPEFKKVLDTSSHPIRNIRITNPSNRQKRTIGQPDTGNPQKNIVII